MEKKMKVEDQVEAACLPVLREAGYSLYDIEYVKEGAEWYLRFFIDKEGGVDLDDCERVSGLIDGLLDCIDPIGHSYYLEISSPGVERVLRKPVHFANAVGETISIKLYHAWNGKREILGNLGAAEEDGIRMILPDAVEKEVFFLINPSPKPIFRCFRRLNR